MVREMMGGMSVEMMLIVRLMSNENSRRHLIKNQKPYTYEIVIQNKAYKNFIK